MTDGSVPKLDTTKLDQFAADLEKLKLDSAFKTLPKTEVAIPSFQRQGYMEKLGHQRKKWFRRFFVLRDSFLLSYNLDKSELTVEPRACIHLANCKVQEVQHGEKPCFFITTSEKDQFLFAVPTVEERKNWIKDIQIARTISHTNMVKLAVENQYLAESKGLADVTKDKSTSALAVFSNKQYIKKTPLIGGAEGWLFTPGFNAAFHNKGGMFSSKTKWNKHYFILRDSHLLMFRGGDVLTKPRGCMYLVGTTTEIIEQSEDKSMFVFVCKSQECGDMIELATNSEKYRTRWINALRIGARVTYRDFKLLLKEHELLATVTTTTESGEEVTTTGAPTLEDDVDIQGEQLDPGVLQAYTKEGKPLLRNPDGKLVDSETGEIFSATEPRFNDKGEQLDPFNRLLPSGAVPMFQEDMTPIGVGPDGEHYLPDGTVISKTDPHFDCQGQKLPQSIVDAADGVAKNLDVAIKVRAHLKGDGTATEAVDVLGRTFRQLNEDQKGMVINADGEKVPINTARVVDSENKNNLVDYKTYRDNQSKTHRDQGLLPIDERKGNVTILVQDDGDEKELGTVEVEGASTLRDVRNIIKGDLVDTDFVFLYEGLPLMKFEEGNKLALEMSEDHRITIRPRAEIKGVAASSKFAKGKIESMHLYEIQKQKEAEEFAQILNQIQSGQYLKKVNKDVPEP